MNAIATLPATQAPAASTAPQSRLRAQRSPAFALLANRADDEEVAGAITDALRTDLVEALESVMADERPADEIELAASIGQIVGLIGQNWSPAGRTEYINLVVGELSDFPGHLVLDALARARRRVTDGRHLVAWICDDVEPKAEKLKIERERLVRLSELSVPAA